MRTPAPLVRAEVPCQAGHGGCRQRLFRLHGRQQAGKALCQHRLARSRWSEQQHRVLAGSGNLQRAPCCRLAFYIGQIRIVRRCLAVRIGLQATPAIRQCRLLRIGRGKGLHHIGQAACTINLQASHQGRFAGAVVGQDQGRGVTLLAVGSRHGQGAPYRLQFARQGQFAGKHMTGQPVGIELIAGCQNADGNRQVEAARVLGQIGRGQIHRDAPVVRKIQPGVLDRAAHPFTRFLDFGIGQPDQCEAGQARGQVHLHHDGRSFQPEQGATGDEGKGHGKDMNTKYLYHAMI